MLEQQDHEVDRTLVERRTYAVGRDTVAYLEERRTARKNDVMDAVGKREGPSRCSCRLTAAPCPLVAWCGPPSVRWVRRTRGPRSGGC
jgi:hypothetical protein